MSWGLILSPWGDVYKRQDKNWGVVPIPQDKVPASCLGGEALCITKNADADACFEFIEYL